MDGAQTEELQEAAIDVASLLLGGFLGLVAGLLVAVAVIVLVRVLLRRRPPMRHLVQRGRRPLAAALGVLGLRAGLLIALPSSDLPSWVDVASHALTIVFIVCLMWLALALVSGVESMALEYYGAGELVRGSRARRVQTQAQMLNRVAVALVLVIGTAAVLLTFPGARAIGTSILASAGIASVVVGLAAQSVLGNLFAGLQIAFTDSLRIDDAVVVEGQQGNVEEITLTYVVVRVWDDRRMILPSSYFTTTPFENLTKTDPSMLGTIELDVDWSVPIHAARAEATRLVRANENWDGNTCDIDVTDAAGGVVRLRACISAGDSGALWKLRVQVREGMVEWLQRAAPYAVSKRHVMVHEPPQRWEPEDPRDAEELEREMAELERAGRDLSPQDTIDRDIAALRQGTAGRPGETTRMMARTARRHARKEDRRRAKERPGALGRADSAQWASDPAAETTWLTTVPEDARLPEPPREEDGQPAAAEYGAVPGEEAERWFGAPERRPVRARLAAMSRHAWAGATSAGATPAEDRTTPTARPNQAPPADDPHDETTTNTDEENADDD